MNIEPLKKAIHICDGISKLAIKTGEKNGNTISMWIKRKNIPPEKVIPLSIATGWEVTPHEFRPDIYPHPNDGLPEHLRKDAA